MATEKKTIRPGDMVRCPICNEDYSTTYRRCPFCDEPSARQGRRAVTRRGGGYTDGPSPIRIVGFVITLALVIAAFIIIFRWASPFFGRGDSSSTQPDASQSQQETQPPAASTPDSSSTVSAPILSHEAVTLSEGGTLSLIVTGITEEEVQQVVWASGEAEIVAVDEAGTLTYVGEGTTIVTATVGETTLSCAVTCLAPEAPSAPANVSGKTGSITNAGTGVNVRSGPGTENSAIATITNGARVTVNSTHGDWYEITFSGKGGRDTVGYVRSDFVALD